MKILFAIITVAVAMTFVFTACKGAQGGKVTDPVHEDPVLTEMEEMVTEAVSDAKDMFTDASDMVTDTSKEQ